MLSTSLLFILMSSLCSMTTAAVATTTPPLLSSSKEEDVNSFCIYAPPDAATDHAIDNKCIHKTTRVHTDYTHSGTRIDTATLVNIQAATSVLVTSYTTTKCYTSTIAAPLYSIRGDTVLLAPYPVTTLLLSYSTKLVGAAEHNTRTVTKMQYGHTRFHFVSG